VRTLGSILRALALATALVSCVSGAPALETQAPIAEPTAAPAPEHEAVLRHLAARDTALRIGDLAALRELLDPEAPPDFRLAQEAILKIAAERDDELAPARTVLATRIRTNLLEVEYLERDDQDRARRLRAWFSGPLERLRQTEPPLAELGEERREESADFVFRFRELDRPQVEATREHGERWLRHYATRLGERHLPQGKIEVRLIPTFEGRPSRLPALASAAVTGGVFYVLSSSTMITTDSTSAYWSTVVVGHELAHILLRGRRGGGFLLNEGLPLWLTGDRREGELARVRAAGALWDLDHLMAGPRSESEFFAGYAQASSFVRFVAERHGDEAPIALWDAVSARGSLDAATRAVLGSAAAALYAEWRTSVLATGSFAAPRAA